MSRMKTFFKYFIVLILLYFISNFLIGFILYSNYEDMNTENSSIEARKL